MKYIATENSKLDSAACTKPGGQEKVKSEGKSLFLVKISTNSY